MAPPTPPAAAVSQLPMISLVALLVMLMVVAPLDAPMTILPPVETLSAPSRYDHRRPKRLRSTPMSLGGPLTSHPLSGGGGWTGSPPSSIGLRRRMRRLSKEEDPSSRRHLHRRVVEGEKEKERVAVVGGGISGLVVGHVLQQSGMYDVTLLESSPDGVGGNVRSLPDPLDLGDPTRGGSRRMLNVGHATHLGMFLNLRLVLRHLNVTECPVGRGPNDEGGIFRMLSVSCCCDGGGGKGGDGQGALVQPPWGDMTSPLIWWEALVFYYHSYLHPEERLDDFLFSSSGTEGKGRFSDRFLNVLFWSMATFEFDKRCTIEEEGDGGSRRWCSEVGSYALGAARALLITQVFFKYLLCEEFGGGLPPKMDSGLVDELIDRLRRAGASSKEKKKYPEGMIDRLVQNLRRKDGDALVLGSYFTSDYGEAMRKLADGIGEILLESTVTAVSKSSPPQGGGGGNSTPAAIVVEIDKGRRQPLEVDRVVFTNQPSSIVGILDGGADFGPHVEALGRIESGAVGVRIVHAKDLPFPYPPGQQRQRPLEADAEARDKGRDRSSDFDGGGTASVVPFDWRGPPCILGTFDISELTELTDGGRSRPSVKPNETRTASLSSPSGAGWLSVAYPVYGGKHSTRKDRHRRWLDDLSIPFAEEKVYPWIKATSTYPKVRRTLHGLQGADGVYVTGHTLTGVNKASELQVTNALNLCSKHFDASPPWNGGDFYPVPMLPDCNDEDAFRGARSRMEAARLAVKSLVGSFLLAGIVRLFGTDIFEDD